MATAVIKTYPRSGVPKVFPYKTEEEAELEFKRIKRTDPKAELLKGQAALDAIVEHPDPRGIGLTAIRTETGVRTVLMETKQVAMPAPPTGPPAKKTWTRKPGLRNTR